MFMPLMIDFKDKNVVIIGGGKVAFRKCVTILKYGGIITVISPDFVEEFKSIQNKITLIKEPYNSCYLKDAYLIVAATNNREINKEISDYCKRNSAFCNVSDSLEESSVIFPSTITRGDLSLSISTSGKVPFLNKKIKKELESIYGEEYSQYINVLAGIREKVLKEDFTEEEKKIIFSKVLNIPKDEIINIETITYESLKELVHKSFVEAEK
ncbi:precorrin-2 dehydrogenase/sirohydrochlorin ferrochelatase family protein [Clostridium polynesiense]|uniref:precorrin-2 dehydrogenase/sirohydrochlorin ferrochelatase family protein n=1 Tax=Clostridium polynesiense TaxID=1325933 RepID=UPI00069446E8|nr:bifunctional precorrin-2 dehydrogenase/sirohydrochlorin ferrochelatase [Clostridium polynesiense]